MVVAVWKTNASHHVFRAAKVHPAPLTHSPQHPPHTMPKNISDHNPKATRHAKVQSMLADMERRGAANIVKRFPASDIVVDPGFNQRTDWGEHPAPGQMSMEELTLSIAAQGIVQPAFCRMNGDGQPHLVAGERRLKGLLAAIGHGLLTADDPLAQFPFLECEDAEGACHELNLLTNSGKPFTYSETARTYAAIVTGKPGFTAEAVAKRTGLVSSAQIRSYLDYLAIVADEIHACVDRGECTATLALDLARAMPDKSEQWEIYIDGWKYAGGSTEDDEPTGQGDGETAIRVTAKHLSVPTGKSPGRYGGKREAHPGVPFQDVKVEGGTDSQGGMWTHESKPVDFPKESSARGAILIATIGETLRIGYALKWAAVRKEDGRVKVLPNVNGKAYDTPAEATLAALIELRGEVEAKDFASTKKITGEDRRNLAVQCLDDLIRVKSGADHAAGEEEPPFGDGAHDDGDASSDEQGDCEDENHVQPDANREPGKTSHQSPVTNHKPSNPSGRAHQAGAPDEGWPAFTLDLIHEFCGSLGPALDHDSSSVATIIANAACGKYPDADKLRQTIRSLLSK